MFLQNDVLNEATANCFICGSKNEAGLKLKYYRDESGKSFTEFVIPEHLVGYKGIFHGGLITAVLDDLMYYAMEPDARNVMTVNINVNFRSPAYTGRKVKAIGEIFEKNGKVVKVKGRLLEGETLLADAEGKFVIVPQEKIQL